MLPTWALTPSRPAASTTQASKTSSGWAAQKRPARYKNLAMTAYPPKGLVVVFVMESVSEPVGVLARRYSPPPRPAARALARARQDPRSSFDRSPRRKPHLAVIMHRERRPAKRPPGRPGRP